MTKQRSVSGLFAWHFARIALKIGEYSLDMRNYLSRHRVILLTGNSRLGVGLERRPTYLDFLRLKVI